ncbi:hypothetical protein [Modestobacter marinus]|nr:hypothetical protein [Modestobacter marinus]
MFVTPHPKQVEAYFGTVTDASGRPSPPRRAGDGTAVDGTA